MHDKNWLMNKTKTFILLSIFFLTILPLELVNSLQHAEREHDGEGDEEHEWSLGESYQVH